MTRKFLIAVAFLGMIGGFALTIRDIWRLAARACGEAEAGGNCMAFARYYTTNDTVIFAVFAVGMAALFLSFLLRPSGK